MDKLLTTGQAAERLGFSRQRVYQFLRAGRLGSERFGTGKRPAVRIRESELKRFEKSRVIPDALPDRK